MYEDIHSDAREAMLVNACGDKDSEFFKKMCILLHDAEAVATHAKAKAPYVTIPFSVGESHVARLESQFDVSIRTRKGFVRSRNTEYVAALQCVLDTALVEHSEAGGRSVLYLDGDVMHIASLGIEGRIVERTHSHSRLASSYAAEDECLLRTAGSDSSELRVTARVLLDEQRNGGGEHFSERVRTSGYRVDTVAINHMKTPVGIAQAAYLVHLRGRGGCGVLPFQISMRYAVKGRLEAFPGWFYVDREADMLTMVPDDDPTMSISHPYTALMSFIDNNSVIVEGQEYLCEKYAKAPGFVFYTLAHVSGDYEVPETLRSHFFDTEKAKVSSVKFPQVKFSEEGVPIGFCQGEVLVPKLRLEKVLAKVTISHNETVTPPEVAVALINENNMVLNTMDSARHADRIDEGDEMKLAVAIALHVNWRRHAARGTLNTLLAAMKLRHAAGSSNLLKFGMLALSAWWQRPTLGESTSGELPCPKVADWCGNDFSVVVADVDPWIEIATVAALDGAGMRGVNYGMPRVPQNEPRKKRVFQQFGGTIAKLQARGSVRSAPVVAVVKETVGRIVGAGSVDKSMWVVSEEREISVERPQLSELKKRLKAKMMQDQGSINMLPVYEPVVDIQGFVPADIPWSAVPLVEPISAIRGDLDDILGGLPERDPLQTGYALAEVEETRVTTGCLAINDAKRNLPKSRVVRRPKVEAGVEGIRVASAASLLGALFKRNIGIPDNQGAIDLDLMPDAYVKRMTETCFKENWQEIVDRHIANGMWDTNEPDVEDYLTKLDEGRVKRMLDEFFMEGYVSLEAWLLMAKGKVKPSREAGSEARVDHAQTILYLESMNTNGMYSSMLRRVKKCLDECFVEGVKMNAQWSATESENWYNSLEPVRRSCAKTFSYNVDSTAYDRSQGHTALRVEMALYKLFGLTKERFAIWESVHGRKRAMSMAYGIIAFIVLTGVSGIFSTLFRNGLVQMVATVISAGLTRKDIVTFEVKGDDVDLETNRPIRVETAVENMALAFNLASKFNTSDVRYFCKKFRIKIAGRWVEVADPWARVQSLCTPVILESSSSPSLVERWESLRADLIHYDNDIALEAVCAAAKVYYGLERAPLGMARGLACLAADKNVFMNFFKSPERIF